MRADLGVPLHTGAPVVQTTHTVHTVQVKDVKVDEHHHEETDFYYTKERISYINLIKNLGILAVLVSIASIVLASIHVAKYPLDFAVILLVAACVFFIASILTVYWAIKASKAFKAHSDLFQPQLNEGLSRTVFIVGLLVAAISAFIVTHLYVEFTYSADYTVAQDLGNKDNLNEYFRIHFIIQSVFAGFFFFFFLLASRAAFNCLKFGNQAMSQLVFLGSFLLLGFALATIFSANQAFPYNDDPALRQLFPVWNIRGLLITSIALAALSVTAFMVDHRSWRVGFFVLAFLLLVSLVLLASFTGYAYRNTRNTYNAIKGDSCSLRMDLVRDTELQDYGCPNKYVTATAPNQCPLVTEWESNANPPVTACLNQNCCGLLGQLYSKHLIQLSAFGLLTTLAAALVSIGCYYFWYVTWVDTARDKRRDFVWLALMGLLILVFIILNFTLEVPRVDQRTWSY